MLAVLLVGSPALASPVTDTTAPKITHARVSKAPLGKRIVIRATIEDESKVFAPSVLVRPKGKTEFDTLDMKLVDGDYVAVIPAEQVTGDLEYVIEAFDEHGNGPSRAGSPEKPLTIQVFDPKQAPPIVDAKPPPPPVVPPASGHKDEDKGGVVTKWWFWTIVGVAAAGGATAIFLATRSSGGGQVDVLVSGPDPAGSL